MAADTTKINPVTFPVPESMETERLIIRSFRHEDAQQLHQVLTESIEDWRQYLWFLPWLAVDPTLEEAEIRCLNAKSNFELRLDLPFLVFERTGGRLFGSVGLHRTDWELPKTEVGYWVRSGEKRKGYATESVTAITAWALHHLKARRIELVTDELNAASRRVAEKCGFALEGIHRNVTVAPNGTLRHNCVYARYQDRD